MTIVYNIGIYLYRFVLTIVSPFNRKADQWISGRRGFFRKMKNFDPGAREVLWIHCSSLGEFEQGRPVLEELRDSGRNFFILLTFYSPSGYEIRKNYPLADAVFYLPDDTPSNARKFIDLFSPAKAVFIKYEFWYNYISELDRNKIPLYLVSANFRPQQVFFRRYGKWFAGMLHKFTHIFVQDENSLRLAESIGVRNVSVAGDTRFDRVNALAAARRDLPAVASFSSSGFTIVAGSTWPADHDLLIRLVNEAVQDIRMIIAPHEPDQKEIGRLERKIIKKTVRYSAVNSEIPANAAVLIIDSIGMLSSLYRYGKLAYIGGGFGKGIHNILEACTFGIPVIFGPNYEKFREAVDLTRLGGAFPITSYEQLLERTRLFVQEPGILRNAGNISGHYVRGGAGATRMIADKILSD